MVYLYRLLERRPIDRPMKKGRANVSTRQTISHSFR